MKTILKILALCPCLWIVGCEKEEVNPEEELPQNCNVIEVSGTINQPTVWEAGNVYVINGANVSVRSVLTIKPGVIVKLKDASIDVVGGKIIAIGTAEKRIVFTSLADDRYCGDNNSDGNATTPAKGDWQQLYLNGTTETIFQYVDILYAGQNRGGFYNAVKISGPSSVSFTFDNCRVAHTMFNNNASYDRSCAFYGTSYMNDPTVSKFTNNVFYDNGKPIQLNAYYTLDPSNKFHNPENPTQVNTHNGIYLHYSSGGFDVTVNWNNTEVPYVLDEYLQVHSSSTINIGSGAIVKFKRSSAGLQRQAPQNINLHPTAILTSYKDDAHGGDTNGDGSNSSPIKGDWLGLRNAYSNTPYWEQGSTILYSTN